MKVGFAMRLVKGSLNSTLDENKFTDGMLYSFFIIHFYYNTIQKASSYEREGGYNYFIINININHNNPLRMINNSFESCELRVESLI
jgi:hypothetical protein